MRFLKISIWSILIVFLLVSFGHAATIEELRKEYETLQQEIDDPTVIWLPSTTFITETAYYPEGSYRLGYLVVGINEIRQQEGYGSEGLAELISEILKRSEVAKEDARNRLLPELKSELDYLISQEPNNPPPRNDSFSGSLDDLTSESRLDELSFDNVMSPDRETNADNYYNSCPKNNPGDESKYKFYQDGQNSSGNYRYCSYFKDGHLRDEKPYLDHKKDGLHVSYSFSKAINSYYLRLKENWSQGELNGFRDIYNISESGVKYHFLQAKYVNHQIQNKVQWHENGKTKSESQYFKGKLSHTCVWRKSGEQAFCKDY